MFKVSGDWLIYAVALMELRISSILLAVYSAVSASASVGKNVAALLDKRQVTDAGKSSSAR